MKPRQDKLVSDELIDEWLERGRKPEDIDALLKQITKAALDRALQGEPTRSGREKLKREPQTVKPASDGADGVMK
jgi:hypothetical protein